MKPTIALVSSTFLLILHSTSAQTITGFGGPTGDFEVIDIANATTNQTSNDIQVSFAGDISNPPHVTATLASPVSLTGPYDQLALNLTGTRTSGSDTLTINLADDLGAIISYSTRFDGFTTGTPSSHLLTYSGSQGGTFNGTVFYVELASIDTAASFTFDSLSAQPIPEPSTYMTIAGFGALGYSLIRRRRAAIAITT